MEQIRVFRIKTNLMQYRLYIDRETNNPSINPIDKHHLCSEMIKFQHVAKARPPNILETRIDLNANITSAVQIYQSRYGQIPSVYETLASDSNREFAYQRICGIQPGINYKETTRFDLIRCYRK